ncbi:HD domain-containing protein [Pseudomonas helleri]|uniref:HD domain-containing protein n=1 Tax=Pseudomonas TaxID=286 RepID=UPI001866AD39|nr:HD domain-containing protein [Pseudomonas lundensis]
MNANNRIIRAATLVFGFWWLVCTLVEFGGQPLEVLENWQYLGGTVSRWILGVVAGLIIGVWYIWFGRVTAMNRLFKGKLGNRLNGVRSTLGDVPMPARAPKRVESSAKRLPIGSELVNAWVAANGKNYPQHVQFFWAIWDTYSAHQQFPASHRKGGHGNRRLWEHCLAVADTALADAGTYVFDGVYVKARGKPKFKIIDLKNKEYRFDPQDPLIPILALAHDIGKLEAYVLAPDGSVITKEEGSALTPQDDNRISHDSLGARILARFPEYWALPARDRTAINLVIGHYHHPSQFPVDRNGLSLDDRMTALMEFLILVDKKTGMAESNITDSMNEQEITEEESSSIYHCFVDIITEYGRVNGTGDKARDSTLKIAQKHDGLVVVKEKDLRMLILAKMGWSLDEGDGRYRVTLNLMSTLQEKGVLYTTHNHADMSRFLPMYSASFRDPQTGAHMTTWEPVIIIRPVSTTPELASLTGLPNLGSKLDIERPLFTHNLGIQEVDGLRALIALGFGSEVAAKANIAGKQSKSQAAAPQAAAQNPPPQIVPTTQPPADKGTGPSTNEVTSTDEGHPAASSDGQVQLITSGGLTEEANPQQLDSLKPALRLVQTTPPTTLEISQPPAASVEVPADEEELQPDELQLEIAGLLEQVTDDNDDDEFMAFVGESSGDDDGFGDAFADFGEEVASPQPVPMIELPTTPLPETQIEQHIEPDELPHEITPVPAPPAPVAVAIPDPDAQSTRRKLSPAAEAAALKALGDAIPDFTASIQPRKKKKSVINHMARVREAITNQLIPVCGSRDGFDYLLEADIVAFDADLDLKALIKAEKLPTVTPKPGCTMIGFPVVEGRG